MGKGLFFNRKVAGSGEQSIGSMFPEMIQSQLGKSRFAQACAFATLVGLAVTSGCRLPSSTTTYADDTSNPFEGTSEPEPMVQMVSATEPVEPSSPEPDLSKALAELEEIGQVDPRAREKLTNDLQNVKPELWPLMIQQFKSALAYRQQVAQGKSEPPQAAVAMKPQDHEASKVEAKPISYTPEPTTQPTLQTPEPTATPIVEPQQTEPVVVSDAAPQFSVPNTPDAKVQMHLANSSPLPPPPELEVAQRLVNMHRDAMVQQATYTSVASNSSDWQADLNSAIAKLQSTINAQPASTDEMHEHVKLRLLQLMAGNRGEAMVPIPGASPALQDYWSKQLFAISTHLNHQQQPDEKRRVASSLYHLDQARAKLAQLATLQVRNLSIVETVDGFGSYTPHESREFRPGEPVSLYAEVENLQSESTPDGYRATLSTSYEVVDISGQRVDGRQFPDVEDVCRNPRRDFHMQYGVSLPERIYPGEYQLRLTITDQQSHKIGHASVSFVIVE